MIGSGEVLSGEAGTPSPAADIDAAAPAGGSGADDGSPPTASGCSCPCSAVPGGAVADAGAGDAAAPGRRDSDSTPTDIAANSAGWRLNTDVSQPDLDLVRLHACMRACATHLPLHLHLRARSTWEHAPGRVSVRATPCCLGTCPLCCIMQPAWPSGVRMYCTMACTGRQLAG